MQILDFNNKPLKDKYCVVLSNIEPTFGTKEGESVLLGALKYFTFVNEVSLKSDEDGICEFKDLTITGSAGKAAYILISVEGIVETWTSTYNPKVDYELPPRGILPLVIEPRIDEIQIVYDFPT